MPCIRHVLKVERTSFPATGNGQDADQSYTAKVTARRDVSESGLEHAFIQVCPAELGAATLTINGDLTFRNPYGYLPVSKSYHPLVYAVVFSNWLPVRLSSDLHPSPKTLTFWVSRKPAAGGRPGRRRNPLVCDDNTRSRALLYYA